MNIFTFLWIIASTPAAAPKPDVQLAHWPTDHDTTRQSAIQTLAWGLRERTSVSADPTPITLDTQQMDRWFESPMVVAYGTHAISMPSHDALVAMRDYLQLGGLMWFDASDGDHDGAFYRSVQNLLTTLVPDARIQRLSPDHVIYKTFYLIKHHGGRVSGHPYIEAVIRDQRVLAVITNNDILGALAKNAQGEWRWDVPNGGDHAREMSLRLGVNIAMYALCLDYKTDQVHIPFILKRRK